MNDLTAAVPLLHDYLENSARRLPDKVALVCGNQRVSYAELEARAKRVRHPAGSELQ